MHAAPRLAAAAAVLLLGACTTPAQKPVPPPAVAAQPALDPSYDWHVLVAAPFGSVFKTTPYAKHEVLLFEDAAKKPAGGDAADCYAIDETPPRWLARTPSEYVLCFRSDRLVRIQAAVVVAAAQAAQLFADACGLWSRAAAEPATTAGPAPAAPPAEGCQGEQDGVAFKGTLEEDAGQPERTLSLTLNGNPDRN
jgi:hypothetical protein